MSEYSVSEENFAANDGRYQSLGEVAKAVKVIPVEPEKIADPVASRH